jgi:hypothetical protein
MWYSNVDIIKEYILYLHLYAFQKQIKVNSNRTGGMAEVLVY